MTDMNDAKQAVIVRTEIGLTIAGKDITLYDVMDYLKDDYLPQMIIDLLWLTESEMNAALSYIEDNREAVEAEYEMLCKEAEEIRLDWEKRDGNFLEKIAKMPPPPGQEAAWKRLQWLKVHNKINMHDAKPAAIVRTERGLSINGKRITLYDVMDYVKAEYSPKFIRNLLNLTESEINVALSYIENNRSEVEAEYERVLEYAEEIRQYWEERNRDRLAAIAKMPPPPGQEAAWEKLQELKARNKAELESQS